jgi:putative transcriptional regulator
MNDVDVKELRQNLKLTQAAFAKRLGIPVDTLRKWEQGRRRPDGAAQTLLKIIARSPDAVDDALRTAS